MLAAEEEGKEDRDDLIELRGLIFISEINMFLHMGEQENGTELQGADSVSAETASDALFNKCFSEKPQMFSSTSEEVSALIPSQLLPTTTPEAPYQSFKTFNKLAHNRSLPSSLRWTPLVYLTVFEN